MKVIIFFGALLATVAAGTLTPDVDEQLGGIPLEFSGPESRIIGGELAPQGKFTYQVLVKATDVDKNIGRCGGSLISAKWVLTAAHCVYNKKSVQLKFGGTVREDLKQVIEAKFWIFHPDYQDNSLKNDIALIKLSENAVLTENVQPILLPSISGNYLSYEANNVVVAGWGKTSDTSEEAKGLRYITNTILPNSVCAKIYSNTAVSDSMICVGTLGGTENKSTCQGDSGSPVALRGDQPRTQIGLVSYGPVNTCMDKSPIVATRITSYLGWIREVSGV